MTILRPAQNPYKFASPVPPLILILTNPLPLTLLLLPFSRTPRIYIHTYDNRLYIMYAGDRFAYIIYK